MSKSECFFKKTHPKKRISEIKNEFQDYFMLNLKCKGMEFPEFVSCCKYCTVRLLKKRKRKCERYSFCRQFESNYKLNYLRDCKLYYLRESIKRCSEKAILFNERCSEKAISFNKRCSENAILFVETDYLGKQILIPCCLFCACDEDTIVSHKLITHKYGEVEICNEYVKYLLQFDKEYHHKIGMICIIPIIGRSILKRYEYPKSEWY